MALVSTEVAMQSLLRLNVTCLTTNGEEDRKLRVVLPNSNTVQQLLHKIESHPECEGKFKELRLMDSGAYLHSQDVLEDVLKESERDLEALPMAESERDDNRWLVDIVQQDYIANRKFREDKHCNYLSCTAGDKMVVRGHTNGWFYCVDESGAAGFLPEWVFEESDASETECMEPVDHMAVRGYQPGLGVVDRICAKTSGYVDSITFYMHDGRHFSYGHGGDRAAEVLLGRDETIQSVTQIEKQSLGEIVVTTSKRELEFRGYFGRGKHFKRHFFECQPGQQIHHLEMHDSVLSGIHEVQIPRGEKRRRSRGTGDRHQRIRLRSNSAQR